MCVYYNNSSNFSVMSGKFYNIKENIYLDFTVHKEFYETKLAAIKALKSLLRNMRL